MKMPSNLERIGGKNTTFKIVLQALYANKLIECILCQPAYFSIRKHYDESRIVVTHFQLLNTKKATICQLFLLTPLCHITMCEAIAILVACH
mmetsp:Transcript_29898/g.45762  ORF Transcript_29898/g.45762 Transcript_29898/m.45762 type:complete len:92 (-) Transcript_29898:919-1194(-)